MARGLLQLVLASAVALAPMAFISVAKAEDNVGFARQRFHRATDLYAQQRYAESLEEFRSSYALYASPNTRLSIARCLRELGRYDEARIEYERTEGEAGERASTDPRYAAALEAARREGTALEVKVARLVVDVPDAPPRLKVLVGGREIPREALGLALPVMPGVIETSAEAPGFAPRREVRPVRAGETTRIVLSLANAAATESAAPAAPRGAAMGASGARTAAWISFGVGVAGLASFGTFWILADRKYAALEDRCQKGCPPGTAEDVTVGRTYETLTNVSLAVGAAGLVTSGVFFLLAPRRSAAGPALSVTPRTVAISGAF